MSSKICILICTIIFCGLLRWSKAEVFTAITDFEPLLDTYKLVIDDLEKYIEKEEKRLAALRRKLDMYNKEYIEAMEDVPNYLGSPINAFTLIKRLTTDIDDIEEMTNKETHFIKSVIRNNETAKYPNSEDLFGAVRALRRLQDTYKLQVNELAEGMINGVAYSHPMGASDCFVLGRVLYLLGDFKNAIAWMMKAFAKYENGQSDAYSLTTANVFDHISWAYYQIGDVHNALVWLKKFLAVEPIHAGAQANLKLFEQKITEGLDRKIDGELDISQKGGVTVQDYEQYEALCRGEFETAPEIVKKLKCFYLTENHPFLRLAPIKAEQFYIDPEVLVFYDVISDREIEHVKALAKPNLQRTKYVHNTKTGEISNAEYRICKYAFLWDDEVTEVISQRTADFTGLNMETAELLQVANYGIGGHYVPQYDQKRRTNDSSFIGNKYGKRIATVLFYMSEVAQGGATVFTKLGLSVFPIKNAALFWMNLLPSGEGDLSTLHATCPVLRGSKWVSNKWIHEFGQEFLKPCSLEYQPEGIPRQYPQPIRKTSKAL